MFLQFFGGTCPGLWTFKSWLQKWGHLGVNFQDYYNMSKGHKIVIPEAGHAWAYILENWHRIAIQTNLFLLGEKIQFSLIFIFIYW